MIKLGNIKLISVIGALISILSCRSQADGRFPFKSYERKAQNGGGADIEGATRDFLARAPIGSDISESQKIFSEAGGECVNIDSNLYPNTIRCSYKHSRIFVSEWIGVITFDDKNNKLTSVKLYFGVNGL